MDRQPQGLLGSMGIQRRDPNAQGETSQPFYNRRSFGDTLARMAPALGRMGVMGLEGPAQAALDSRNERQGDERARAAQAKQRNDTAEWLRSLGSTELADGVANGSLTGAQAMSQHQSNADRARTAAAGTTMEVDGRIVRVMPDGTSTELYSPYGAGQLSPDQLSQANTLRDDFRNDTQEFREVRGAYQDLSSAYEQSTSGDAGVSDYALVIGLAKVLDPTSVVREAEAAAIQNTSGMSTAIKAQLLGIINEGGGTLSRSTRDQIMNFAAQRYNNVIGQTQPVMDQYATRAEQANVPWEQIGFEQILSPSDFTMPPPPPTLSGADLAKLGVTLAEWPEVWAGLTDQQREEIVGAN